MSSQCECVQSCGEGQDGACDYCRSIDSYEPCPRQGYGCGTCATDTTERCDCCTPEQWTAAREATGSRNA